jgi:tRNA (guanine-N7-)-methyltransferase
MPRGPRFRGEPAPIRPRFRDHAPEDFRLPDLNPHLRAHLEAGPPVLTASAAAGFHGRWAEAFGREAPLVVEIGSGNGFFLAELARRNPGWNVLGIEIRYKRVMLTAKKLIAAGVVGHARIARYDAWFLDDLFTDGSVRALWVNHPDPWPKDRHEKNRLLGRPFLEEVARILEPGGLLHVKSDTRYNVERVQTFIDRDLEGAPLPPLPLEVVGTSEDVNTGPAPWGDDIETNYQRKFKARGLPVYGVSVRRR